MTDPSRKHHQRRRGGIAGHVPAKQPVIFGGIRNGHEWFVNPARRLSVVSFTNTAFEGVQGTYPIDLRDAIYYALTSES